MNLTPRFYPMVWLVAWIAILVLPGCNRARDGADSPTLDVTQAYQTVEARLTEAVAETGTVTTTPSPFETDPATTPGMTITPSPLPTTDIPVPSPSPTSACDLAAPGAPIDVTIPDDTRMQPDQSFTKTWRLQNVGACTWDESYDLVWFSGERMGAPQSVPLRGRVRPGDVVDLSVDMVAPAVPGAYQSNWKLRNSAGVLFGIGPRGDASFWVRIIVVEPLTTTPSPEPPATPTPTATSTVAVQVSGSAVLNVNDRLDLDTNQIITGNGEDLVFLAIDNEHALQPVGSAALAVVGSAQPELFQCQTIALNPDPLVVDNLEPGTYFCYRTNLALPGWARLVNFNQEAGSLTLEILTWAIP